MHASAWVLPIRGQPQASQSKVTPVVAAARSNKQLDHLRYGHGGIREYKKLKFVQRLLEKRTR